MLVGESASENEQQYEQKGDTKPGRQTIFRKFSSLRGSTEGDTPHGEEAISIMTTSNTKIQLAAAELDDCDHLHSVQLQHLQQHHNQQQQLMLADETSRSCDLAAKR